MEKTFLRLSLTIKKPTSSERIFLRFPYSKNLNIQSTGRTQAIACNSLSILYQNKRFNKFVYNLELTQGNSAMIYFLDELSAFRTSSRMILLSCRGIVCWYISFGANFRNLREAEARRYYPHGQRNQAQDFSMRELPKVFNDTVYQIVRLTVIAATVKLT